MKRKLILPLVIIGILVSKLSLCQDVVSCQRYYRKIGLGIKSELGVLKMTEVSGSHGLLWGVGFFASFPVGDHFEVQIDLCDEHSRLYYEFNYNDTYDSTRTLHKESGKESVTLGPIAISFHYFTGNLSGFMIGAGYELSSMSAKKLDATAEFTKTDFTNNQINSGNDYAWGTQFNNPYAGALGTAEFRSLHFLNADVGYKFRFFKTGMRVAYSLSNIVFHDYKYNDGGSGPTGLIDYPEQHALQAQIFLDVDLNAICWKVVTELINH
jgi:hypothetical protein